MDQKHDPGNGRMATLDLLRLLAALAVVGFHYLFRGGLAVDGHGIAFPYAANVAIYGYLGVNLFFLISGFVIAWSAEGRTFSDFAVARFARLYPGFVLCMTITFAVLIGARDPELPTSVFQYFANLFMFSPALGQPFMDGVYWSIVLELIFYGWVAIALLCGVVDNWKLHLLLLWLVLCALNEFALHSHPLRLLFITEYGPLFISGILLHHMHSRGRSSETIVMLIASFLLSTAMLQSGRLWMIEHYGKAIALGPLVIANIALYGLIVSAIMLRRRVTPSPIVLMLGGLTYPLYLLHQNIGYVAIARIFPAVGKWPAVVLVTVAMLIVSWTVWRFCEKPARRRIRQLMTPIAENWVRKLQRYKKASRSTDHEKGRRHRRPLFQA